MPTGIRTVSPCPSLGSTRSINVTSLGFNAQRPPTTTTTTAVDHELSRGRRRDCGPGHGHRMDVENLRQVFALSCTSCRVCASQYGLQMTRSSVASAICTGGQTSREKHYLLTRHATSTWLGIRPQDPGWTSRRSSKRGASTESSIGCYEESVYARAGIRRIRTVIRPAPPYSSSKTPGTLPI